jgi:predicted secreted protein
MAAVPLRADIAAHLTASLGLSDPAEPASLPDEMIDRVSDEAIR